MNIYLPIRYNPFFIILLNIAFLIYIFLDLVAQSNYINYISYTYRRR